MADIVSGAWKTLRGDAATRRPSDRPDLQGEVAGPAAELPESRGVATQERRGGTPRDVPLRVFYAAGPGDVLGTYGHWARGQDDPHEVAVTYSGQFFDVCRQLNAKAVVISSSDGASTISDGSLTVRHLPYKNPHRGHAYHLHEMVYDLRLVAAALAFRADLAVIGLTSNNWNVLSLLPWFGVQVVPSLHCVLWPKYAKPGRLYRIKMRLGRNLFAGASRAILCLSSDIADQVKQLVGSRHAPLVPFLPSYRRETFAGIRQPDWGESQFRVLFAGRIERNKGVYDLLEVARRLQARGDRRVMIDLCGGGSCLADLKSEAEAAGLADVFRCHGQLARPEMREMYAACHVVVAPTTSDFVEGFNKVVVEGVLAGRPVLTSTVCPAAHYLGEALELVPPDDVPGYLEAILRLSGDFSYYERRRAACAEVQEPFYDPDRSWGAGLKSILTEIRASHRRA